MSWGQELWDQYDPICAQLDRGAEFVKRVSGFVKDRIHAEQNYAKELRKLCKGYRKKEEEESKYSQVSSFSKMVAETNDLAGQRELIAEYLQNDVMRPMQELIKWTLSERKRLMLEGAELHRALKESMDQLERSKRIYMKASEEKEQAAHALEKADNDPQSTKAKIDKLTQISRAKDQAGEEARNNYILQLEATNTFRREHYTQKMPKLMDDFMQANTTHIKQFQDLVSTFAESNRKVHPVINTCLNNITASAEAIDPAKDNQQFSDERKTGYPVPGDVDFEEYHGKIRKKDDKKRDDKKKVGSRDFSHLPPEQRKRKLVKKIGELEGIFNKTTSDRVAMEKMIGIYQKNPSLGDANLVAQQLQQTDVKLEELQAELAEFRGYLAQAEGRDTSTADAVSTGSADRGGREDGWVMLDGQHSQGSPRQSSFRGKNGKKKKEKESSKVQSKLEISSPHQNQTVSAPAAPAAAPSGQRDEWFSDDEDGSGGGQTIAVPPAPAIASPQTQQGKAAILLYDFDAQTEDEVSCRADERVSVTNDMGDGWLQVVKDNGSSGYIPESYVEYV